MQRRQPVMSMLILLCLSTLSFAQEESKEVLQPPSVMPNITEKQPDPEQTQSETGYDLPSDPVSHMVSVPLENQPCESVFSPCAPPLRIWTGDAEFLFWFIDNEKAPLPLASTVPCVTPAGCDPTVSGANLQSDFFFEDRPLSGARFTVGYWLEVDKDQVLKYSPVFRATGVEAIGFFLAERSINFQLDSQTLSRPFFGLNDAPLPAFPVAAPGAATGTIFGTANIDLWGMEANGWKNVFNNSPGQTIRIDVMGGLRNLNMNSSLNIRSTTLYNTDLAAFPVLAGFEGNRIDVSDNFQTSNTFIGAQAGFNISYITSCFIVSSAFKLGLGAMHQQLDVAGTQLRTFPTGATTTSDGGLLALPSNSGRFERTKIGLVPEVDVKFEFPIGHRCMCFFGYSFLGMSNVIRPAAQIDPVLNVNQIPNFPTSGTGSLSPGRPKATLNDEFLFIHGLNVGARLTW